LDPHLGLVVKRPVKAAVVEVDEHPGPPEKELYVYTRNSPESSIPSEAVPTPQNSRQPDHVIAFALSPPEFSGVLSDT
jgi:hypothetical protein